MSIPQSIEPTLLSMPHQLPLNQCIFLLYFFDFIFYFCLFNFPLLLFTSNTQENLISTCLKLLKIAGFLHGVFHSVIQSILSLILIPLKIASTFHFRRN